MGEFLLEIDVILVGEKLVELVFVGSMRTLDFTIELG